MTLAKLPQNYAISLLLWLVSLALGLLDIIYGRLLIMGVAGLFDINYWVMSFIDRAGILIIGLIVFAFVIFLEYFYRVGAQKGLLWSRFGRTTMIQLIIIAAGIGISWVTA